MHQPDIRLQATIWIWVLSFPCLIACVPIVKLSASGILLPYLIFFITGVSTVSIWLFDRQTDSRHEEQVQVLKKRLEVLESLACLDEVGQKVKALDR